MYVRICMYVCMYVCVYVCMYVCMYVCVCVYVCIHLPGFPAGTHEIDSRAITCNAYLCVEVHRGHDAPRDAHVQHRGPRLHEVHATLPQPGESTGDGWKHISMHNTSRQAHHKLFYALSIHTCPPRYRQAHTIPTCGKPCEALIVHVRAQRRYARDKAVQAQVKLAVIDEVGTRDVPLHDAVKGWRDARRLARQKNALFICICICIHVHAYVRMRMYDVFAFSDKCSIPDYLDGTNACSCT
jgi:hypothetical protein